MSHALFICNQSPSCPVPDSECFRATPHEDCIGLLRPRGCLSLSVTNSARVSFLVRCVPYCPTCFRDSWVDPIPVDKERKCVACGRQLPEDPDVRCRLV